MRASCRNDRSHRLQPSAVHGAPVNHTLHRWQRECIDLLAKRVRRPEKTGMVQAFTGAGKSVVQSYLSQMLVSTLRSDEVTIFETWAEALPGFDDGPAHAPRPYIIAQDDGEE